MIDLAYLAANLLANFHTVRLPASERREDHADWSGLGQRLGRPRAGPHTLRATDCAPSLSSATIIVFCTIWNPTRTVDGGSTSLPPMTLPSRFQMSLAKANSVQVIL
jgi:hypothetical protein